jgi:stage II sporulation protein D
MKRFITILISLLVLVGTLWPQQTDVTVRIFSVYALRSIRADPQPNAMMRLCATCPRTALHAATVLQAAGNKVAVNGKSAARVELSGTVRFQLPDQRSQTLQTPVQLEASAGQLTLVTRMAAEGYVVAVVQGETAGDMPPEALKAMAVVARTYTAWNRGRHQAFDFCDSTHCQYMRPEVTASVAKAVEQTRGETLWVKGVQIPAYYHKDCGGHPELASAVWPREANVTGSAYEDPYCVRVAQPWRAEISGSDITRALTGAGVHLSPAWNRIIVAQRTASGRAATLLFTTGNSVSGVQVAASTLRFALGRSSGWQTLKSDLYDVGSTGDKFAFTGHGVGHGVGLCQTGAAEMAREGKSYREILAFYFPGALVGRSAQGIPWQTHRASAVDVQVVTPGNERVMAAADSALRWAEARTRFMVRERPVVAVFPTIEMYRDSTGEPGWVAASTRDNVIRLQPLKLLRDKLDETLRHEFVHLLLEANALNSTPLWFREGLAIYLAGESAGLRPVSNEISISQIDDAIRSRRSASEMKQAYAAAAARVRALAESYGRDELLRWLRSGLPAAVLSARSGAHTRQRSQ